MSKNGQEPIEIGPRSELLPINADEQILSSLDSLHVQVIPLASATQGSLLQPDDSIEYSFALVGSEYNILPGDKLSLSFNNDKSLDSEVTVRPDGVIALKNNREVKAAGKSPAILAKDIITSLEDSMNLPLVAVDVLETNFELVELEGTTNIQLDGTVWIKRLGQFKASGMSLGELSEALSNAASEHFKNKIVANLTLDRQTTESEGLIGFDKTIKITETGLLFLPEIGFLETKNKTLQSLREELQEIINSLYANPVAVAISKETSETRVVYVDGELGRPGSYKLNPEMTMLQAIATAGGVKDSGDLRSVILIHRNAENDAFVYISNLKSFIANGTVGRDLYLSPNDIVIVPRTKIAKINLWVEQYIARMLPFSRSVSYSYFEDGTAANLAQ